MPLIHDILGVLPRGIGVPGENAGAEVEIDLMEAPAGVMKLVHKADLTDGDGQPGFLMHLPAQIVRQGLVRLDPAPRRAQEIALAARPCVDEQQPPGAQDHGADSEADGAGRV